MKLYKETEFQETPIGKVPKEWKVVKLKDTCELIRGTEPGSKTYNKEGKGFKFIRVSDISKQILETVFVDEKPENLVFCHKENVLLALDGVPGIVAKGMEGAISSGIRIVKPVNKIDNDFLFYILQHSIVQKVIMNYTTGTTIKHASRAVDFITLPLPPILEQQKIAEILLTIDGTVRSVNDAVARLENLNKALMNKLLTGRVRVKEENGKLVFHRETEFQETEIGEVSKEWKIVKLKDIVTEIKSGFASGNRDELNGIIHLRMFNVSLNGYVVLDETIKVPKPREWKEYLLKHGDILLVNTSGSKEHIGKVAFFDMNDVECAYSNHLTRIRIKENVTIPKWVHGILYYLWYKGYYKSFIHQQAGGQRNLPLNVIENLPIILPPLNEQKNIVNVFSIIDNTIKLYRKEKEVLERLKKGLMDLLLTGKVRVRED
jgi:type I restriction enzyme S subunit